MVDSGHVLCFWLVSAPSASDFLVDDLWLPDRRSPVDGYDRCVGEAGEEMEAWRPGRLLGRVTFRLRPGGSRLGGRRLVDQVC